MRSRVAAMLVALIVAGCGAAQVTPTRSLPSPSAGVPSASLPTAPVTPAPASPAVPVPSPGPTAPVTPEGALPALELPRLVGPATALHAVPGTRPLATWGSRAYTVDEPLRSGRASLLVTDLAVGATTHTAVPLLAGETTVPPDGFADPATIVAADAHWLAVVVWKRLGPTGGDVGTPCSGHEEQPVAWRLLVTALDPATGRPAGAFRVLDHGTNSHPFTLPGQGEGCGGPRTPRVSLDGDEIAYTVEETGAATSFATRIEVRTLPAGSLVRSLERPQEVLVVALSGGLLAWQPLNHPDAGVWVEQLGASPEQVVPPRPTCWLGGATAGWVGMCCVPTGYQAESYTPYQPVVWSPATGLRQLAGLPRLVVSSPPSLGGGSLMADGGSPIEGSGTLVEVSLAGLPTAP